MIGDTISRTRRSPFKRFRPLILDSIPSTFVRKRPTITTRLEEQISILLYLLTCFIIIVCWEVCHCHVSIVIYLLCSQRPPIYRFITTRKWEEERSTKLLSNTWQSLSASAVTYHLHDSLSLSLSLSLSGVPFLQKVRKADDDCVTTQAERRESMLSLFSLRKALVKHSWSIREAQQCLHDSKEGTWWSIRRERRREQVDRVLLTVFSHPRSDCTRRRPQLHPSQYNLTIQWKREKNKRNIKSTSRRKTKQERSRKAGEPERAAATTRLSRSTKKSVHMTQWLYSIDHIISTSITIHIHSAYIQSLRRKDNRDTETASRRDDVDAVLHRVLKTLHRNLVIMTLLHSPSSSHASFLCCYSWSSCSVTRDCFLDLFSNQTLLSPGLTRFQSWWR